MATVSRIQNRINKEFGVRVRLGEGTVPNVVVSRSGDTLFFVVQFDEQYRYHHLKLVPFFSALNEVGGIVEHVSKFVLFDGEERSFTGDGRTIFRLSNGTSQCYFKNSLLVAACQQGHGYYYELGILKAATGAIYDIDERQYIVGDLDQLDPIGKSA